MYGYMAVIGEVAYDNYQSVLHSLMQHGCDPHHLCVTRAQWKGLLARLDAVEEVYLKADISLLSGESWVVDGEKLEVGEDRDLYTAIQEFPAYLTAMMPVNRFWAQLFPEVRRGDIRALVTEGTCDVPLTSSLELCFPRLHDGQVRYRESVTQYLCHW